MSADMAHWRHVTPQTLSEVVRVIDQLSKIIVVLQLLSERAMELELKTVLFTACRRHLTLKRK